MVSSVANVGTAAAATRLFIFEFGSFYLGRGVFALVIRSEPTPNRLPNALLRLTTQCLQSAGPVT